MLRVTALRRFEKTAASCLFVFARSMSVASRRKTTILSSPHCVLSSCWAYAHHAPVAVIAMWLPIVCCVLLLTCLCHLPSAIARFHHRDECFTVTIIGDTAKVRRVC